MDDALDSVSTRRKRVRLYEERVTRTLRRHGCRITGPRIQVARRLAELTAPATAYELHAMINRDEKKIDVVSVYRILDTLRRFGLVYHVGSVNAYFPVLLENASDRFSEIVLHEDDRHATELAIPAEMLQVIESQARSLGVAVTGIRIELLVRDAS